MAWTPYSIDELEHLLKAEQSNFSGDEHAKFNRTKVPIRNRVRAYAFRSEQHADDGLFVVASDGETALVFDDFDQEFGICKAKALDDGPVRDWGLAGSLVFALMHLK